ncbi:unnamed protein product [Adineta steineri]|uniref:ADP ribosyltransferase domain-containing protein n=1 Tax=Adineta steineri TaxID=433720 RepID=A0A815H8M5_9BILA|nr:unnamed protein product [Adineta steineri]CAF1350712.1 unnamed protein product [Adineta steineri]
MAAKKSQKIFGSPSSTGAFNASVTTTTPSTHQPMAQNYLLVWVDASIDQTSDDCRNTLIQLQAVINDVTICAQPDECIEFLDELNDKKAFVITSGSFGQRLVPEIHCKPKLDAIYIFCDNISYHQQWTKNWRKIKGVHNNITDICDALKVGARQVNQDSIPISFVTANAAVSSDNLNQLEPNYMYTQIFKEILLEMDHDHKQAVKDLSMYYRKVYRDNTAQLKIIDEFEHTYRREKAIWWYTRDCFTYEILNRALRTLDADIIINMGFFIHDLHQRVHQLHEQQLSNYDGMPFIVYRGQGLLKTDFDKLNRTKGGLISFNNFLSTSNDQDVSFMFAASASADSGMVGILFIMTIDPSISSTPFASIDEISDYNTEEEILFSMHTVFRIGTIKQMDNNNQLYQVELQLTADDDKQLRQLTKCISEEARGKTGWERLGTLLLKTGHFDKAEELYKVLLDQPSSESDKALYYNNLGYVKDDQGDYEQAIKYYQQGREIYGKTLPTNHSDLAASYNNIGEVYRKMGEYSKALSFYEKACKIFETTLPANHPSLAIFYNNIGSVYDNMGEYSKALLFYEKALGIREKTLPANHPSLAISYNNIGSVSNSMGEYSKALSFYEKARETFEKTLSANHPSLPACYNNIGSVYDNMAEYSKALSFYEKALKIYQKTLPENHPDLATSYNNIGSVYNSMGEYSNALSFYEKVLGIREKTLSANHPSLAISYNNIGAVYDSMGEYSKALSFYEKALGIREKTLPVNHPSLAASYNNIGLVHDNMGEYPKALLFYEKTVGILEKTLPANHVLLATSYNNIGGVYKNMGKYPKALSFYEKTLEIEEKTLPANHPSLAISYNNIGSVYYNTREHLKALSFFDKTREIFEETLPANHPSLATSYSNIGSVYKNMGEYSKALFYFERALKIKQHSLPANHPSIQNTKESIEIVKKNYNGCSE